MVSANSIVCQKPRAPRLSFSLPTRQDTQQASAIAPASIGSVTSCANPLRFSVPHDRRTSSDDPPRAEAFSRRLPRTPETAEAAGPLFFTRPVTTGDISGLREFTISSSGLGKNRPMDRRLAAPGPNRTPRFKVRRSQNIFKALKPKTVSGVQATVGRFGDLSVGIS